MSNATAELDGSPVLNPFDPFVFITPELAWNISVLRYVCIGTAGALIWDFLNSMIGNYRLLFHHRIRLPTVVYFISKIATLAFVIGMSVFATMPIPNCVMLKKCMKVIYAIAVPCTSLLFLFRTRAVFDRDRWVVIFFTCMWLAVAGACIAPIFGVFAGNIGPTKYCMTVKVKFYTAAPVIVSLVNDTLIFVSISWRLRCNSSARRTVKDGIRVFIFGDDLPAFSKAMLKDGQVYFLTVITFNLVTATLLFITSMPPIIRTIFTVPNTSLMNIMACRLFRNMKLGAPRENDLSTSILSMDIHSALSRSENGIKQEQITALSAASMAAQQSHDNGMVDDKDDISNISFSMV